MSDQCNHADKSTLIDVTTLGEKRHRYLCPKCGATVHGAPLTAAEVREMNRDDIAREVIP